MAHQWLRKPRAIVRVRHAFSLLGLLPLGLAIACGASAPATSAPASTSAPTATTAPQGTPVATAKPVTATTPTPSPQVSAGRLKVAALPGEENNDPHGAAGTALVPMRNIYEYLVEIEPYKGAYAPMLATEWKLSPDGKSWDVKLRKGVQWHRGFGEFTAQDVVHTYKRLVREGALSSLVGYWRANLDNIEIINDYEVVFHMKRVELEWQHQVSTSWDGVMLSKSQFDKEGQEGFAAKPAGTGPYQYVERRIGTSVSFERVPYDHWRIRPDFKELEFLIVREELTRLASLLAGEVHIAEDIPLDVQSQALAKGMKVVRSTVPSGSYIGQFGGNYLPSQPNYDPSVPWTNKKVRQALNLAINQKEIIDTIFLARYEQVVAPFVHRTHPEYKPEWEAKFKQNYAYDPARAKLLLREAGYPQGFKATFQLHTQPGAARQDAVAEAVANYWQAIGVDVKLENVDQAAHVSQMRGMTTKGKA